MSQPIEIKLTDLPPSANGLRKSFVRNGKVMSAKTEAYTSWRPLQFIDYWYIGHDTYAIAQICQCSEAKVYNELHKTRGGNDSPKLYLRRRNRASQPYCKCRIRYSSAQWLI